MFLFTFVAMRDSYDAAGNRRGGDLASIMEPDGSVALTSGAGEDRVIVSLQQYIADHCVADAFKDIADDKLADASLYKSLIKLMSMYMMR